MKKIVRSSLKFPRSISFALLSILLLTLCVAGGASRADVMGQVIVRGVATVLLVIGIIFGPRPSFDSTRPVFIIFIAIVALVLVQLLPLPPSLWLSFPGRKLLAGAAALSGQAQPWRPWAIVPSMTRNAAASLIIPAATLVLSAGLKNGERRWLPGMILGLVVGATILALMQSSGAAFRNPLINDDAGNVGGIFANRNHLALFLSFGLLIAPCWAFSHERGLSWRGVPAVALILLFLLTILVSGSRAGLIIAPLALAVGLLIVRKQVRLTFSRFPRWVFPVLIATIALFTIALVLTSFEADRAVSITRALTADPNQDFRSLALPTLAQMIRTYFPMGYGFGGFDPIFRMYEPFALLDQTYFNHAHNDLLEIVLEAGLPGLLLLLSALSWWGFASIRAWRRPTNDILPRIGSAMLLLVLIASIFDYPARTPMIMAMIAIAGLWLSGGEKERLPVGHEHL